MSRSTSSVQPDTNHFPGSAFEIRTDRSTDFRWPVQIAPCRRQDCRYPDPGPRRARRRVRARADLGARAWRKAGAAASVREFLLRGCPWTSLIQPWPARRRRGPSRLPRVVSVRGCSRLMHLKSRAGRCTPEPLVLAARRARSGGGYCDYQRRDRLPARGCACLEPEVSRLASHAGRRGAGPVRSRSPRVPGRRQHYADGAFAVPDDAARGADAGVLSDGATRPRCQPPWHAGRQRGSPDRSRTDRARSLHPALSGVYQLLWVRARPSSSRLTHRCLCARCRSLFLPAPSASS